MARQNNQGSLIRQVQRTLQDKLRIGGNKHNDKTIPGTDGRRLSDQYIYGWSTYRTYEQHCCYFVRWCRQHGCKTLEQCRPYAAAWLQSRIDAGLSPYTVKLEAAALGKLYGCATQDFGVETPSRQRDQITRSRGAYGSTARDRHFSVANNADLIAFCRATGLRRSELEQLRGDQLGQHPDGTYYLSVTGKGGRYREAPIIGSPEAIQAVVSRCEAAGAGLVWGRVHSNADIHSYRAEYATAVYEAAARPIDQIPWIRSPRDSKLRQPDVLTCRGKLSGQQYDRQALLIASQALGHNRVSVVAEHYLRLDD